VGRICWKGRFWAWSEREKEWWMMRVVMVIEMSWQVNEEVSREQASKHLYYLVETWLARLTEWIKELIPEAGWCISEWAICDFQWRDKYASGICGTEISVPDIKIHLHRTVYPIKRILALRLPDKNKDWHKKPSRAVAVSATYARGARLLTSEKLIPVRHFVSENHAYFWRQTNELPSSKTNRF